MCLCQLCWRRAEGMEVEGRYGDEVMYNLQDGRVMFVPLSIRDQIRKLEVKPGEPLQVCNREVDVLGEPCIEWTVSRREPSQVPKAVQVVQRKLEAAGLVVTGCSKLSNHTGWQLCCAGGEVVNVFDTGRVLVQGKNDSRVRSILGLEAGKANRLQRPRQLLSPMMDKRAKRQRRPGQQEEWRSQTKLRHANGAARSARRHQGGREVR